MSHATVSTERRGRARRSGIRPGFTTVELLVAMVILVMVFGLVTLLYIRTSRISRTVTSLSEIDQVLSQMMTAIATGESRGFGLAEATRLETAAFGQSASDRMLIMSRGGVPILFRIAASARTDTTMTQSYDGTTWRPLDPNGRVVLQSGSGFQYLDVLGAPLSPAAFCETSPTVVRITLRGRSTDRTVRHRAATVLEEKIRLRNRLTF